MKHLIFFSLLAISFTGKAQDTIKVADNILPVTKLKSLTFSREKGQFDFISKFASNVTEKFQIEKLVEAGIAAAAAACTNTPPVGIAGLTGGYRIYEYQMSIEQAYKLKIIAGGDASADIGKEVYVYDHVFYKKDKDCKGNEITWGAGVRLLVKVKKTSTNLNITGLAAIAASAEIKAADASVEFKLLA
jgi:hypothetical protein